MSYQSGNGTGSLLWCVPYGAMTPASWGALQAARYMHKYGVTNRELGYISVQQRAYAAKNPAAWFYEKPITLEDHQNSKWIQEDRKRVEWGKCVSVRVDLGGRRFIKITKT